MIEFIFFDDKLQNRFCDHLRTKQIGFSLAKDTMGQLVRVDLDETDTRADALEDFYDTLMQQQEAMLLSENAENSFAVTAITVHLQDGATVYANVDPELMNRLLSVLRPEEVSDLVDAIASAIENHDTQPLCKR